MKKVALAMTAFIGTKSLKGMWLILTKGRTIENIEPNSFYEKCGFEAPVVITSHIDMKSADGSMVVGWLASQTDMLAEDWVVL